MLQANPSSPLFPLFHSGTLLQIIAAPRERPLFLAAAVVMAGAATVSDDCGQQAENSCKLRGFAARALSALSPRRRHLGSNRGPSKGLAGIVRGPSMQIRPGPACLRHISQHPGRIFHLNIQRGKLRANAAARVTYSPPFLFFLVIFDIQGGRGGHKNGERMYGGGAAARRAETECGRPSSRSSRSCTSSSFAANYNEAEMDKHPRATKTRGTAAIFE